MLPWFPAFRSVPDLSPNLGLDGTYLAPASLAQTIGQFACSEWVCLSRSPSERVRACVCTHVCSTGERSPGEGDSQQHCFGNEFKQNDGRRAVLVSGSHTEPRDASPGDSPFSTPDRTGGIQKEQETRPRVLHRNRKSHLNSFGSVRREGVETQLLGGGDGALGFLSGAGLSEPGTRTPPGPGRRSRRGAAEKPALPVEKVGPRRRQTVAVAKSVSGFCSLH